MMPPCLPNRLRARRSVSPVAVSRPLPAYCATLCWIAVGLLITGAAAAVPLSDPVRLSFNDVEDRTTSGSVMRDCEEQYAVWMQAQAGMGWSLVWSDNFGGDWSEPQPIDPGEHPDYEPRVGGGPGAMCVVWKRDVGDNAEIMYACGGGSGPWTVEPVTSNVNQDLSPDIADNGDGRVHVAWAGWDPERGIARIFYGVRELAGGWTIELLENSELGPFWTGAAPRISVNYQGVVHIVYRGGNFGDYHCHYARKEAGEWSYQILDSGNVNDFSVDVKVVEGSSVYVAMSGNDGWAMPNSMYVRESHDGGVVFGPAMLVSGTYSAQLEAVEHGLYGLLVVGAEVSGNIYTENLVLSHDYAEPELLPPANNASQHASVSEAKCISDYPPATSVLFTNRGDELHSTDSTEVYVMMSLVPGGIGDGGVGGARLQGLRIQAAPNPFNTTTWITVDTRELAGAGATLAGSERFEAAVYDVSGRLVRRLDGGAGTSATGADLFYVWDGTGVDGRRVRSGSYYLRIGSGGRSAAHRLVVVR